MTKWLPLLALSLFCAAQAAPPADCTKPMWMTGSWLSYTSKAAFPQEPENVTLKFLDEDEPAGAATVCGFSFKPDLNAQALSISAPTVAHFARLFPEAGKDGQRIVLENSYSFADAFGPGPSSAAIFDPKTYKLTYKPPGRPTAAFVVGVKIDGGKLQPLYYDRKATPITVPRTASTIDLYVKVDKSIITSWQRITISLKKPTLRIYEETVFPAK